MGKHPVGKLPVGNSQPAVEGILAVRGTRGRLAVGGTQAVGGRPPVVGGTLRLQDTEVQKL